MIDDNKNVSDKAQFIQRGHKPIFEMTYDKLHSPVSPTEVQKEKKNIEQKKTLKLEQKPQIIA